MTVKLNEDANMDVVAATAGLVGIGAVECAAKYGAAAVARHGTKMLASVGKSVTATDCGAKLGTALMGVVAPELLVIGGILILSSVLLSSDE